MKKIILGVVIGLIGGAWLMTNKTTRTWIDEKYQKGEDFLNKMKNKKEENTETEKDNNE